MKTFQLRNLTRIRLILLGLALCGTTLMAQTWTWTTVFIKPPFVIRSYGGKCLDFGPPPQLSGAPVFIYDCNGTIAQQVSIEEVNARHDVILRAGTKVIGVKSEVITRGVPAVAQLALLNAERALELQDAQNSEAQVFALDGDSIVQASNRNRVVKVLNNRGTNRTPLILGQRDLADNEFWTFIDANGWGNRPTSGFVRVTIGQTPQQFVDAVAKAQPGTVIEVDPAVSIDLTDVTLTLGLPLRIPEGVTIRGDRRGTRPGPELWVREGYGHTMLEVFGDDVRLTGLRLRGPTDSSDADVPGATGIFAGDIHPRTIIDHNDISKWPDVAVAIGVDGNGGDKGTNCQLWSTSRPHNARVVRNFIHHNEKQNLGYGVGAFEGSYPLIEANTFLANRHAIAADGVAHQGYRALHNLVLSYAPWQYKIGLPLWHTQDFDVHGTGDNGFGGRAGEYFEIARNTFLATNRENFDVRGEPCQQPGAEFHNNVSLRHYLYGNGVPAAGSPTGDSLYPAIACSDCGAGINKLKVNNNQFGAADPTNRLGVGDFDGDGTQDLFLATGAAWYYAPAGTAEWRFLNAQTDPIGNLLFGDFDGDGRTDVFTQHGYNWDVSWGGASRWETINVSGPILGNAAVGNFTGDRRDDIFYADGSTWWVSDGGVGQFTPLDASGYRVADLRFGDFDGDGKTDVFGVGSRDWQVAYSGTSGWTRLRSKLTDSVASLIVADFNGDRRADVATASLDFGNGQPTPSGWRLQVSYSGMGNWTPLRTYNLGQTQVAGIGRFNAGAGADVLLWHDNYLEISAQAVGVPARQSREDMR